MSVAVANDDPGAVGMRAMRPRSRPIVAGRVALMALAVGLALESPPVRGSDPATTADVHS